jgi:hypothetical protein
MCRVLQYSLLSLMILLFSSCSTSNTDSKIFDLFSDFIFVGSGPAKLSADGSIDQLYVVIHGDSSQNHPRMIKKEVQYIFHESTPTNDESFATKDFPDRLRGAGFRIIKAAPPMAFPFMGGPLFTIRFEAGKHEILFYNRLHGNLAGSNPSAYLGEDYILIMVK